MSQNSHLVTAIEVLLAAYPRAELHTSTPELYRQMLDDIPELILSAAIKAHISTSPYFPTVSQIREQAARIETGAGAAPPATDAWWEVCEQMRSGNTAQPKFSHPFVDRVVTQMGWYNLRMSENQVSDRARFIETYDALVTRVVRQYVLPEPVRRLTELKLALLEAGEKETDNG